MENLVQATGLTRHFGHRVALSGVDISLAQGNILGLLGPNGAGKTTCLRLLCGLLSPSAGRVEILGADIARQPLVAKRHLGYLPEQPPLYPELRVDEYLEFCGRLRRVPRTELSGAVTSTIARCGLKGVRRRLVGRLSKGYRQRVGIAQAILHRPRVLILDEPTDGLDPVQMREVRGLVRDFAHDSGVIVSSHLLPEVQALCDRVLILHEGRVCHDDYLGQDHETHLWRVRLSPFSEPGRLDGLHGIEQIEQLDEARYRVTLASDSTSADLARQIVAAGLELCELTPERSRLERVFFDLVGAEATP